MVVLFPTTSTWCSPTGGQQEHICYDRRATHVLHTIMHFALSDAGIGLSTVLDLSVDVHEWSKQQAVLQIVVARQGHARLNRSPPHTRAQVARAWQSLWPA